jgi:cold shock CspA family protein
MNREYFFGKMEASLVRSDRPAGPPRGVPDQGWIVKLFVGRGHGFIRLSNDREVYFHRADVQDGTSINDFQVGDVVAFERIDDRVSGARAQSVRRRSLGG